MWKERGVKVVCGNGAYLRWMVKAIGAVHTSWFVRLMAGCGLGPRTWDGAWGFG